MTETKKHDESIRIAHLTMLQGVITRMGANSFTLKALAVTFGSAAVVIMATVETPSPYCAVAAVVPMIIFWLMDAQYLRLAGSLHTIRGWHRRWTHSIRAENRDDYRFLHLDAVLVGFTGFWRLGDVRD